MGTVELSTDRVAVRLDVLHGETGDDGDRVTGVAEPAVEGREGEHPERRLRHPLAAESDEPAVRDSEGALVILEKVRRVAGKNPEMNALIQVAEEHFIDKAYRHFLPPKKIPILKKPLESLVNQDLSPEEGFLVTRVNGAWDLRSIISISPLREVDALRAFKKLRERGIIDLVEAQARSA